MNKNQEERYIRTIKSEIRMITAEGDKRFIEGYAALYNVESSPELGFRELILPGAFDKADMSDVRMLWNHNDDLILARTKNHTLRVEANDQGLWFSGEPAETSYGLDALVSVKRGDVDQSSFAFSLMWGVDDEWEVDDDGKMIRHIKRIRKVFDVSPTAFPAYSQTKIDARKLEEIRSALTKPVKHNMERIDLMLKVQSLTMKS